MNDSIWRKPLESLYLDLAAAKPAPAGVTAAAVSARLGLGLLIKTLEITKNRKHFPGDATQIQAMIESARRESAQLAAAADDDITADAARRRSEIPMFAVSAAEAGLKLCGEAAALVSGPIAADLEVAVQLLTAARRAILICVESNRGNQQAQARP